MRGLSTDITRAGRALRHVDVAARCPGKAGRERDGGARPGLTATRRSPRESTTTRRGSASPDAGPTSSAPCSARHVLRAQAGHGSPRSLGGSPVSARKVGSHLIVRDPSRQCPRTHTASVDPVEVGTGFQQQPDHRPLALRTEHRPPQRRIAMAIHGTNRRTRGQENLDGRWRLGLSRETQRRPACGVGCLRTGAPGQQHPQAFHVPLASRTVHRRPPQPIPISHAALVTHALGQTERGTP